MKNLLYKGAKFDSFTFENDASDVYKDEGSIETLEGMTFGWAYICPQCIKKYGLHEESLSNEKGIDEIIQGITDNPETEGMTCCIKDCYNKNAWDLDFDIKDCELADSED